MKDAEGPVRVGQIGCGHWARHAWVPNIIACPDAELVALCDVDPTRAEALAAEFYDAHDRKPRPAIYSDYREMIAAESLDMAIAGTLAQARPESTIAALQAGLHVLAAKPMAPSLAEAEAMIEASEKAGRLLMVGYNYRFRDDAGVVHRFIREGGIGKPLFACARAHSPGIPSYAPHYVRSMAGGGSLASTGIHTLDLAVWFLGNPPLLSATGHASSHFAELPSLPSNLENIRGDCDIEIMAVGFASFAGGVSLASENMWMSPGQINKMNVEVWGSRGYASLSPLRLLTWEDGDFVDKTEVVAPGLAASFRDTRVRMQREIFHFVDCVLGRAEPLITTGEMWTDQAIMEGIYNGSRQFQQAGGA